MNEHLIYCGEAKISGYINKGRFFVMLKKQEMLDALYDICNDLKMEYAIIYHGKILLQTEMFNNEAYKADIGVDSSSYRYQNYWVKKYSSKKIGEVEYVYLVDYDNFGGNVAQMVRSLALIILIMFALCVILSRKEMKRIRSLYVDVLEENVGLEGELYAQIEILNRQFLSNVLHGYDFWAFDKRPFGFECSKLCVLSFKFADIGKLEGNCGNEKEITKVLESCLKAEHMQHWLIVEKDARFVCVIGYETHENVEQVIIKLQYMLEEKCETGVLMGLSTEVTDVTKLPDAYEEAGAALYYCGERRVVKYVDIMELEKVKIYYPLDREIQLLRSTRLGMREETEKCLTHIWQVNFEERHLSKGAERQLMVKMMNTVYEMIDAGYDGDASKYDEFGRVSRKILQTDNAEQGFEIIRTIILAICNKCASKEEVELRGKIIDYIENNFSNHDLSLEQMSTDFGMSYFAFSRIFNEYMQVNFSTYLTGKRLEYSKELLCTTSFSVEQIAVKSGFYQSHSFIRAFKKYYGVTPGKYREELQKKG